MFAFKGTLNQPNPSVGPQARTVGSPGTNAVVSWTRNGAPITTAITTPVLGTSCGNFNTAASTCNIKGTISGVPVSMANFGTGDFTAEFWIRFNTAPVSGREIFTNEITGGFGIRYGQAYNATGAGVNAISLYARGAADQNYGVYTWAANVWNFVVCQRKAGVISFWAGKQGDASATYLTPVNGPGGSAATYNYASQTSSVAGAYIGGYGGTSAGPRCYFNELQLSNFARYADSTAPIQIPTTFLPVDQYTTQEVRFQGSEGGTVFANTVS